MSKILKVHPLSVTESLLRWLTTFSDSLDQVDVLQGVDTAGLKFRLVDAKEQVVGRLAAQLSVILQVRDSHHLYCIKRHTLCMFCQLIACLQLAFCCGA